MKKLNENNEKEILGFQIETMATVLKELESNYEEINSLIDSELKVEYPWIDLKTAREIFEEEKEKAFACGEDAKKIFFEKHPVVAKLYILKETYPELFDKSQAVYSEYATKAFLNGYDDLLGIEKN